jgi:hypothetical protein
MVGITISLERGAITRNTLGETHDYRSDLANRPVFRPLVRICRRHGAAVHPLIACRIPIGATPGETAKTPVNPGNPVFSVTSTI